MKDNYKQRVGRKFFIIFPDKNFPLSVLHISVAGLSGYPVFKIIDRHFQTVPDVNRRLPAKYFSDAGIC